MVCLKLDSMRESRNMWLSNGTAQTWGVSEGRELCTYKKDLPISAHIVTCKS